MDAWNRFWYGDDNPPPTKKAAGSILAFLIVTCWFGLRAEFMLSEYWLKCGTAIALVLGLIFSPWFGRVCADAVGADLRSRAGLIPLYLSAFAGSSIIAWILIAFVAPAWSTKWVSSETYAMAELRKVRHSGRYECTYQIHGEYIRRQPAGHICISSAEFERLPPSGPMVVREKRSIFGTYVEGVEPRSANKLLQPIARDDARSG